MTSEIQYIYLLNKLLEDGERETRNGKTAVYLVSNNLTYRGISIADHQKDVL